MSSSIRLNLAERNGAWVGAPVIAIHASAMEEFGNDRRAQQPLHADHEEKVVGEGQAAIDAAEERAIGAAVRLLKAKVAERDRMKMQNFRDEAALWEQRMDRARRERNE